MRHSIGRHLPAIVEMTIQALVQSTVANSFQIPLSLISIRGTGVTGRPRRWHAATRLRSPLSAQLPFRDGRVHDQSEPSDGEATAVHLVSSIAIESRGCCSVRASLVIGRWVGTAHSIASCARGIIGACRRLPGRRSHHCADSWLTAFVDEQGANQGVAIEFVGLRTPPPADVATDAGSTT
jgi:hypothetical protein